MRFVDIARRVVTAELTPEDCQRIAAACAHAARHASDSSSYEHLENLGSAFEAAAMAALVESYAPIDDADNFTLERMREGKLGTIRPIALAR